MKEWIILPEYQNHFLKRIKYRAVYINMVIWTQQKIEFASRKISQMENNQYGAQRRTFEIRDIKDMFKFLLIHDQNPRWRERENGKKKCPKRKWSNFFKIDKNKTQAPTSIVCWTQQKNNRNV